MGYKENAVWFDNKLNIKKHKFYKKNTHMQRKKKITKKKSNIFFIIFGEIILKSYNTCIIFMKEMFALLI